MEINIYLAIISIFLILFAVPFLLCTILKNKRTALKIFITIWFVIYLAFLFIGTTANIQIDNNIVKLWYNFNMPWFKLDFSFYSSGMFNIFTNLAMMFPIGFFIFSVYPKNQFLKTIFLSLIISIIIELYQWILPVNRHTEIFDVVLNVASGIISAIYCLILKMLNVIK